MIMISFTMIFVSNVISTIQNLFCLLKTIDRYCSKFDHLYISSVRVTCHIDRFYRSLFGIRLVTSRLTAKGQIISRLSHRTKGPLRGDLQTV